MGVEQLFPQLKGAWRSVNLQESARGESVGIDAFVWLHALATRHAASVVLVGDFTSVVADFIHRSEWLLRCGMTPTFVFDGARLPAKDRTAESRAIRSATEFAKAQAGSDAEPCEAHYRAAIKIELGMLQMVIAALRTRGFQYVVAPYEADSQLVHLCNTGCVDAVISVDGDLSSSAPRRSTSASTITREMRRCCCRRTLAVRT